MMSICQWGKNCKQRFAYSSSSSVSRFNFSARIHHVLIKDLIAREVWKMWDVKAKVIPVVMGALGSVPVILKID